MNGEIWFVSYSLWCHIGTMYSFPWHWSCYSVWSENIWISLIFKILLIYNFKLGQIFKSSKITLTFTCSFIMARELHNRKLYGHQSGQSIIFVWEVDFSLIIAGECIILFIWNLHIVPFMLCSRLQQSKMTTSTWEHQIILQKMAMLLVTIFLLLK